MQDSCQSTADRDHQDRERLRLIVRHIMAGETTGDRELDQNLQEIVGEVAGRLTRRQYLPLDPLQDAPAGTCRELRDGSGRYYVRGNAVTGIVSPRTWHCSCDPLGALSPCEHIRELRDYLRSGKRECPACHGCGERVLNRADLDRLMESGQASAYGGTRCEECDGAGQVPLERARQLKADQSRRQVIG